MFAVIETGGKQLKVGLNDVIRVEKLPGKKGDKVTFGEVLLVSDGKDLKVGSPLLKGAAVGRNPRPDQGRQGSHFQEKAPPQLPALQGPPPAADGAPHHRHRGQTRPGA